MFSKWIALWIAWNSLFFLHASEPLLDIYLRNPTYKNGVVYTNQGGVVQAEDLRIQAMQIQYFHRMENGVLIQKLEAEGDLLIQYKGKAYVGSELEFDLQTKTGSIYDGKTFSSLLYIRGDRIDLSSSGGYHVTNASVTTCENKDSSWEIRAEQVHLLKDKLLQANTVRFQAPKFPALWLPSFRWNLEKAKQPLLRYYANWNKGPKLGIRYQLYSWKDLDLFARLEYRWSKGWGGALESEYLYPPLQLRFTTRNYAGTDRLFNAEEVLFRYRIQGALRSVSQNGHTHTTVTWDKYSDVRMPGDFKSEDFEVDTALKTLFFLHHIQDPFLTSLKVRPRVNSFESIQQDLPTFFFRTRPFPLFNGSLFSSTFLKASYLNFQYSDDLVQSLQNFHSPRIELYEKLTRPFMLGPFAFSPYLGARAIFYGTSPQHTFRSLGVLEYGLLTKMHGTRPLFSYQSILEPYLEYKALSRPTVASSEHYLFSIQDGYEKIQQIEAGIRQLLFSSLYKSQEPFFSGRLYTNAFFSDPLLPRAVPRAYLQLLWQLSTLHFSWHNCYNFYNRVWDFSNAKLDWTLSENAALRFEARYRSQFDWRKSDHENFILDVSRSEKELLESPLSDRRITLLSHFFFRLTPFWELELESHHGFYRLYKNHIHEKPYNEFKIHLYTTISSAWKLHFYYGYTLKNHFDWNISLQLMKKTF